MSELGGNGSAGLYVAVIVMESSSDAPGYEPLYEESIVLLREASIDDATARAERLGRAARTEYRNEDGETITWSLKHVVDVSDAVDDSLADGTTIYARHFRDYDAYRRFEPLLADADPDTGR